MPPRFTREELRRAFATYRATKDECSRTGDWRPFARLFTVDAFYVEHAYGMFFGRDEIEKYIVDVMAPFPTMRFYEDWIVYDEERGAIIWQLQNVFPAPMDAAGLPFQFPNMSRLVYAGEGLFSEEQDWYNPSGGTLLHAAPTTRAWRRAGGVFQSAEKLRMMHDAPSKKAAAVAAAAATATAKPAADGTPPPRHRL